MAATERLGLDLLDSTDVSRPLLDVMQKLLGNNAESSLNRIDDAIGKLQDGGGSIRIVESETEPAGLNTGDEWDLPL